jgi:hypothetical protein
MMTIKYPRRFLNTHRQLMMQCALSAGVLQPVLIWRFSQERPVVSLALFGLALSAMVLSYRGWVYLTRQELHHSEPTPDMVFVFTLIATFPTAINTFLLILLFEM